MMSHHIPTRTPTPPPAITCFDAATMMRYDRPAQKSAKANFAGLEKSMPRRANAAHTAANTDESVTTNSGGSDWNHTTGMSHPRMCRSVKSRAKRFSDVGACSYADQKHAEKMKSTRMTTVRRFSSLE